MRPVLAAVACGALLLTACEGAPSHVSADETTVTTSRASSVTVSRLTHTFTVPPFNPDARSVGNFRFDVAPAEQRPLMTEDQVIAAVGQSGVHDYIGKAGTHTAAFFGLFSGSAAIVGPSGKLLGNRPIDNRPAWMVVVTGIDTSGSVVVMPNPEYAITVINDSDGQTTNSGVVDMGAGVPGAS